MTAALHRDIYNDNDPGAAAWLEALVEAEAIPAGAVNQRSILDLGPDDLLGCRRAHFFAGIGGWAEALRLAGWPDGMPVWTGSPPCQPFSVAGKRGGADDVRHLGPRFVDLVRACRPPVLFGEQVASADVFGRVAGGRKSDRGGAPAWTWCDDLFFRLEAAGYAAWAIDIPAAGVGAPHIRQRCFFAAVDLRFTAGVEHTAGDGRIERRAEPDGRGATSGCGAGGLADAYGRNPGAERQQRCGEQRQQPQDSGAGGLADAKYAERWSLGQPRQNGHHGPHTGRAEAHGITGTCGKVHRPDALDGFWRGADWIFCRDEQWRPVEPGVQPLAHGVSGRVGLLRGAGNAIVPQAAAKAIEIAREAMIEAGIWSALRHEYVPAEVAA